MQPPDPAQVHHVPGVRNGVVFSRDVDESLESMQLWPFVDVSQSRVETIVVCVYENECRHLFYGWGNAVGIHSFPPFDRFPYTDVTGNFRQNSLSSIRPIPGYDWVGEWTNWVTLHGKTDDEGYEYAVVWHHLSENSITLFSAENPLTRVRRRCVRRIMSRISTTELLDGSKTIRSSTFYPYQLRVQIVRAYVTKGVPLLPCKLFVQLVFGDVELGRTQSVTLKDRKADFNEAFTKEVQRVDDTVPVTLVLQMEKVARTVIIGSRTIPKEHLWNVKNKRLVSNLTLDDKNGCGNIDIEVLLEFRELFCVQTIMNEDNSGIYSHVNRPQSTNQRQRSVALDPVSCQGDLANKFKLTERILRDCGVSASIRSSLLTVSATEFLLPSDVYDVLRDLRNMKDLSFQHDESFFALAKANYPKGHMKYSSTILFHTVAGTNMKLTDAFKDEIVAQLNDVSNWNEKLLKSRQLIYPNDNLFIKTPKPSQFHMLLKTDLGQMFALRFHSFADYVQAAQTFLLISVGKDVDFSCAAAFEAFDGFTGASDGKEKMATQGIQRASKTGIQFTHNIRDRVSALSGLNWTNMQLSINGEHDFTVAFWTLQSSEWTVIPISSISFIELLNCHMLPLSHVYSMSDLTLSVPAEQGDVVSVASVTVHTVTGQRKVFIGNDIRKLEDQFSVSPCKLADGTLEAGNPAVGQRYRIPNLSLFIPGAFAQELTTRQLNYKEDVAVVKVTVVLECCDEPLSTPTPAPTSVLPTSFGTDSKAQKFYANKKRTVQKALEGTVTLPVTLSPTTREAVLSIDDEQSLRCSLQSRPKQEGISLRIQRVNNIIGVDANGKSDVYFRIYLVDALGVVTSGGNITEANKSETAAATASRLATFMASAGSNARRSSAASSPGEVYRSCVCKATVNPYWPDEGDIILTEEDHRISLAIDVLVEFWDANRLNADVCLGELRIPVINIQNADTTVVRCSEIAPSMKMTKVNVEKKYFGTVNYTCCKTVPLKEQTVHEVLDAGREEAVIAIASEEVFATFIGCLEPSSTHLFRWPCLLITSETTSIPPSLCMHMSFDGLALSYAVHPHGSSKKNKKFELLASCRESVSWTPDATFREVVVPWSQINVSKTIPICASTLIIEVTLHRVFYDDASVDIGEANMSPATSAEFPTDKSDSPNLSHAKTPPTKNSRSSRTSAASMLSSDRPTPATVSSKEFTAKVVVGPCPAFHLMELLESRINSHEIRRQMMQCSTMTLMEDMAKLLLCEIQHISSDIVISSMSTTQEVTDTTGGGMQNAQARDEFAKLLSSNTENMDHVAAHCNSWELYTSSSLSRRALRLLSLQRLRLKGYFSLLIESLAKQKAARLTGPSGGAGSEGTSTSPWSNTPSTSSGNGPNISSISSIEKHVNKKIGTLIAQNKKLNEKLDDMIYALEEDVIAVIITNLSSPGPGSYRQTHVRVPSNGESALQTFARQLTTLIHTYFLNITWYFSSVIESGKFDMQSDPQSKHALLQALISKDDWIELLIGSHLNTCELKFSRRPLLSYIIDFDALLSMFSSLLNAEIQHWDANTIESFSKAAPTEYGLGRSTTETSPASSLSALPVTLQPSLSPPTYASQMIPWEVEPVSKSYARSGNPGSGVVSRTLIISPIPENVRYQLQIQIWSKHVNPCSSMSARNLSRIATINREVAVAVINSYRRLGEGYERALENAVRNMQKLQFERIRREYKELEDNLAAHGHGSSSSNAQKPNRPSLVLNAVASFRQPEVSSLEFTHRQSLGGVPADLMALSQTPTAMAAAAKDEQSCLEFVISIANDSCRIAKEHLPMCENELSGDTALASISTTRSETGLSLVRMEGFQDVDMLFNQVSDRSLNALANVVFLDISPYFLHQFDHIWRQHIHHTEHGNGPEPVDPISVILETLKEFNSVIGLSLEPGQQVELISRCFRRVCLRYLLFVRDTVIRAVPRTHDEHVACPKTTTYTAGNNLSGPIQRTFLLAVTATEHLGQQLGHRLQHFTSDLRLEQHGVEGTVDGAKTVPAYNDSDYSATPPQTHTSQDPPCKERGPSSPSGVPYITFSDEERTQFVVDYNKIRTYFVDIWTDLSLLGPSLQAGPGMVMDDRYIAFGLNQLDTVIRSLFASRIDRHEFIDNMEDTICAVWKTHPPQYPDPESSFDIGTYDLAICKYLGISSISSAESEARRHALLKFRLQISDVSIVNSKHALWKLYIVRCI
jgi:hypothetical protein